jgi:hypothetical protein
VLRRARDNDGDMEHAHVVVDRRDAKGRFLVGNKPPGGRPLGSRNKLTENFLAAVEASWRKHGATVLDRVAQEEPAQYLRAICMLMPKDVQLDVNIDVRQQIEHILADFRGLNLPDRTIAGLMKLIPKAVIDADAAD